LPTKVLVVEDEPDQLGFLEIMLRRQGYVVFTAHDGKEGIRQAEAHKPDLIISDICMTGLDGAHMIEVLHDNPEFSKIPILVISAYGGQYLYDAIKAGASDAMRKPIDLDLLFSKMITLLDTSLH
jgi:two-component system, OmpR family, alkaline phosphatase synthesis response regulator PhoP